MTQEEKELLLKVIGEQFPYNVLADGYPWIHGEYVDGITEYMIKLQGTWVNIENVKPYLRPMSSMTDEEKEHLQSLHNIISDENYEDGYSPAAWDAISEFNDYCHAHHLDNRGLIGKGLALEAPEQMYN